MKPNPSLIALTVGRAAAASRHAAGFSHPDAVGHPDLYRWTDTCNVQALRDGDAALLIDLGDGSVPDHLDEIGMKRVEWVLFTHHHRDEPALRQRFRQGRHAHRQPEQPRMRTEQVGDDALEP